MHASNPETIYSAGSGDWTQARLITVSGSARTVPMSHRDKTRVLVAVCLSLSMSVCGPGVLVGSAVDVLGSHCVSMCLCVVQEYWWAVLLMSWGLIVCLCVCVWSRSTGGRCCWCPGVSLCSWRCSSKSALFTRQAATQSSRRRANWHCHADTPTDQHRYRVNQ